MNDATVSGAVIPRGSTPARSWRDATTPLSRASRRRWTPVYPLLLTAVGVLGVWGDDFGLDGRPLDG